MAGTRDTGSRDVGVVARYLPDGNLDPAFDVDGIATVAWSNNRDSLSAIAVAPRWWNHRGRPLLEG